MNTHDTISLQHTLPNRICVLIEAQWGCGSFVYVTIWQVLEGHIFMRCRQSSLSQLWRHASVSRWYVISTQAACHLRHPVEIFLFHPACVLDDRVYLSTRRQSCFIAERSDIWAAGIRTSSRVFLNNFSGIFCMSETVPALLPALLKHVYVIKVSTVIG